MREELEQINWNEEFGNREKDINAQWNFIKGMIKNQWKNIYQKGRLRLMIKNQNVD